MATALQTTTRRQARESYVRYLLHDADVREEDADNYLTAPQAALDDKSILELIYTGDYEKAVSVVERFIEEQPLEDNNDYS